MMKTNILPALFTLLCFYSNAQVGNPDPSFGKNGIQLTGKKINFLQEAGKKLLPLPGGGFILVINLGAGSQGKMTLTKYSGNDEIDKSFGNDGFSASVRMTANDAALQPDGKIVVVGYGYDPVFYNTTFNIVRYNPGGSLDTTFSGDGMQITQSVDFNSSDIATGVAIQGSQIIVGGLSRNKNEYQLTVCQYNANGSLDDTFGISGIKTTSFPEFTNQAFTAGLILQGDKIVLAATDSYYEFALVRFNSDGSVDDTFGTHGLQTTGFINSSASAYAIAAQGNKIVVAGSSDYDFAVARYNYDGSLDSSFDGDGKVTTSFGNASAKSVAILGNKIIVGGDGGYGFAIAQYNNDGSLDNSFNGDGKLTTLFNNVDYVKGYTVALQGSKIIMAGETYFYDTTQHYNIQDFAVAKYNTDGTPDKSFSQDGMLTDYFPYTMAAFNSAVIQNDEKVVAVGTAFISNLEREDYFVARHNKDGSLDSTFDMDGIQTLPFEITDAAVAVKMQGDKIVVAGNSSNSSNELTFAIARFNSDGSLDSTFGNNGKVTTAFFAGSNSFAKALAIQADKIVVVGYTYDNISNRTAVAIARYNVDGSPDQTFSQDGLETTHFSINSNDLGNSVAIQGNKIIVAGESYSPTNDIDFFIVRYNTDGTLDHSFNGTGFQLTDFGSFDEAESIQIKGNTIIVAGSRGPDGVNGAMVAVAHYNDDGSLDTNYDGDGKSASAFPLQQILLNTFSFRDSGELYVAGSGGNGDYSIFRYNTDGSRDIPFNISNPFPIENLITSNDRLFGIGRFTTDFSGIGNLSKGAIAAYIISVCTNSWTGAVNNLWENPANWSCGTVPDENSDVIIDSGTIQINSNVIIRSLHFNPGVIFTVAAGYNLTITH